MQLTEKTLKLLKLPADASPEQIDVAILRLCYERDQLELLVHRASREVTKKLATALLDDLDAVKRGG